MYSKKILTVIVPAYNVRQYIKQCLKSMLRGADGRQDFEIIVVNDGSVDDTKDIAESFAAQYPDIVKVISKENGGHGSAINTGIANAAGKYLKVVDGDDWVKSGAFYNLLDTLKKCDADLIVTPYLLCPEGKNKKTVSVIKDKDICPDTTYDFKKISNKIFVRMHEMTIRTDIMKTLKIDERLFYVDMEYILFPIPYINTVYITNTPVYCYRLGIDGQSVSVKSMQDKRRQHLKVMYALIRFYKRRCMLGDDKERLDYIAKGIAQMEANQTQTILSLPISRKSKAELVYIENKLKDVCTEVYGANSNKSVEILRKSRYRLYHAAALAWHIINYSRL